MTTEIKPILTIDDDMVRRGIEGLHDAADINLAGDMDWPGMMRAALAAALDDRYEFEAVTPTETERHDL